MSVRRAAGAANLRVTGENYLLPWINQQEVPGPAATEALTREFPHADGRISDHDEGRAPAMEHDEMTESEATTKMGDRRQVAGGDSVVPGHNALRSEVKAFGNTGESEEVRAVAVESDAVGELVVFDLTPVMRRHRCN